MGQRGYGPALDLDPPLIRWKRPTMEMIDAISMIFSKRCSCDVTRVDVHGARLEI
jgi:hypothetical protein